MTLITVSHVFSLFPFLATDDDDDDDDDGILLPRQDSTTNKARCTDANQERSEERSVNAVKNST